MKLLSICFFISSVLIALAISGCSDINSSTTSEISDGIKSVIPARAPFGAHIVIAGKGFKDVQQVLFNGTEARINAVSDSVILTQVPLNAASGPIEVITSGGTFTGPSFTVDSTDNLFLAIHAVRPTRVRVEDTVRISGIGFNTTTVEPNASQQNQDLNITSSNKPNHLENRNATTPGIKDAPDRKIAKAVKKKRVIVAAKPEVFFNDISALILSVSDTLIIARVPQNAETGLIAVIVEADTAIGPKITIFRHAIAGISPTLGPAGTKVTIKGSDFSDELSENIVTFNGTPAQVLSASANQLITEVPEGASSGIVAVKINNTTIEGPTFDVVNAGTLIANITTSGSDLDTNGYLISVDEAESERVKANDTFKQSGLAVGNHEVLFSDIATNCFVSEEFPNPRTVDISAGKTTTIQYTVICEGTNEPPIASFTTVCTDLTCDFDASESSDSDGSIESYEWVFDDGTFGTGKTISHTYATSGAYTAELKVTDNEGGTGISTKQITLSVPEITSISPESGFVGAEVTITGSGFNSTKSENMVYFTSGNSMIAAQVISASQNELGVIVPSDATTGSIQVRIQDYTVTSPVFTVQVPGVLEVRTRTTGDKIDSNGYLFNIEGVDARNIKANDTIIYNELSEGSYKIGISNIAANCQISGQLPNPRTVTVAEDSTTVADFYVSCSATNAPPVARFTYSCTNLSCDFDASSSSDIDGDIESYNWVFGNMGNGTGKAPSSSFEVPGTYNVKLTVTDNNGATDTTSKDITLTLPEISGISPTSDFVGVEVTITGSGFSSTKSENKVSFTSGNSTVAAQVKSASKNELVVIVPSDATTGPIQVEVHGYTVTSPAFTVQVAGTLEVRTHTTGDDLDPDGYLLNIQGVDERNVQVNDTVVYNQLTVGSYQVGITDIAANCQLSEQFPNPRTVDVTEDNITVANFEVYCPSPNTPPVASFTYTCTNLSCDFDASGSSDSDGTIESYNWVFGNMGNGTGKTPSRSFEVPGTYNVQLVVTDDEGATDTTSKDITLTLPRITSISPTSGKTGSIVTITGSKFSPEASENVVTFNGVRAELNSASITKIEAIVPSNGTTGRVKVSVDGYTAWGPIFTVQQPKTLEVIISTEGTDKDPDGYTLSVVGQNDQTVSNDDHVTYTGIYSNQVAVKLTGVADNCRVDGENPRTISLNNSDNWGTTYYTIDCTADIRGEIIYTSDRKGNYEIYRESRNGTNQTQLTDTPNDDEQSPALSPDGLSIAFVINGQIFIMDSDGSSARQITQDGYNSEPSWSPKGNTLAFERYEKSQITDLYTINIDGTGLQNLTNTPSISEKSPDWSSDGDLIVYSSDRNNIMQLFTIKPNGTGEAQLIANGSSQDTEPEWSPDGTKIAFIRNIGKAGNKIFIVQNDGTGAYELTPGSENESSPSWSPDGSMMTFAREDGTAHNIVIFTVDYDDVLHVSYTTSDDKSPHWNY